MATPAELRDQTLSELRAARRDMASMAWEMAVEKKSSADQTKAALTFLNVGKAIRALENQALADFRAQLAENEKDLTGGIEALSRARQRLSDVAKVLKAIDKVLAVVGKLVQIGIIAL